MSDSDDRNLTLADIIQGVAVEDFGGNLTIRVSVAESNKAPTDILLSNDEVADGDPPATVVGILTAVDENINDTHTFNITLDVDDKFTIVDNANALLTLKNSVDFAAASSHDVTIEVTDSTNLTFEKIFTITVLPIFDNSLSFLFDLLGYVNMGSALDFERTDTFSMSCWFKTTAATGAIIARRGGSAAFKGWEFNNTSGQLGINLSSNNVTGNRLVARTTLSTFNDGVWHNYICTYDGSSSTSGVLMIVDGVNVAVTSTIDNLTADISNDVNGNIASRNNGENPWGGNLDEISLWDKVLTLAEAQEIYNSGNPDNLSTHSASANLLNWWRMGDDPLDDATGGAGNIQDQVGGINGTPVNTDAGDIEADVP